VPTRFLDLEPVPTRKTAWNLDLITTFYIKCAYSPKTQAKGKGILGHAPSSGPRDLLPSCPMSALKRLVSCLKVPL
jgi:hypothetical protein